MKIENKKMLYDRNFIWEFLVLATKKSFLLVYFFSVIVISQYIKDDNFIKIIVVQGVLFLQYWMIGFLIYAVCLFSLVKLIRKVITMESEWKVVALCAFLWIDFVTLFFLGEWSLLPRNLENGMNMIVLLNLFYVFCNFKLYMEFEKKLIKGKTDISNLNYWKTCLDKKVYFDNKTGVNKVE